MGQRNQVADVLRGLAALWVCLYHFTGGVGIGSYGYLGVTVFFVISGFVVPTSMVQNGYVLAAWPRFMLRRLVRLEPPYLVSIGVLLALGALDRASGTPPPWTTMQIVGHLGYANAFLGLPWLNSVYWSLAVEFQFYILMGIALPLLLAGEPATRLAGVALVSSLPLLLPTRSNATIFPFLSVFGAGILSFLRSRNLIGRKSYWGALLVVTGIVFEKHDAGFALATVSTAVLLVKVQIPRIAPIAWLGAISYSLYLLHVPIGHRVISLMIRVSGSGLIGIPTVAGALAASMVGAALLCRWVEKPSLRWAAKIGYRRNEAPRSKETAVRDF
jgi:peptidoglycan/LPS O-acetylase OafA/YrhL